MDKWIWTLAAAACVLVATTGVAQAQDDEAEEAAAPQPKFELSMGQGIAIGAASLGAGLAAIGGGYAISRIGARCIDSMARQPEAAGAMFGPMVVTAAMVEGGMFFAMVVCLLVVLRMTAM